MKIFISWSGDLAKEIAEIFKKWIPGVLQAAKPYYSPDDITKGTRWSTEIAKELDESKVGIICLTKENLQSSWIMFEAGALSKNLEKSKVCPLLFEIEPSDIIGPLIQFQAAKFSKKEMKKVVQMMNNELDSSSLSNDVLDNVFNMWWPKLEDDIKKAIENAKNDDKEDLRSDRDLLEEIVSLTRRLNIDTKRGRKSRPDIHPAAIHDIIKGLEKIVSSKPLIDRELVSELFMDISRPLRHIIGRCSDSLNGSEAEEFIARLETLEFELEKYRDKFKSITRKNSNDKES